MRGGARFRNVAKCVLFMLLLAWVLSSVNKVLAPKYDLGNTAWPTTSTIRKFYAMETNSVDVLFLGSSVAVNQFIPQLLYDEFGIRSFNLGSEQQSPFLSYHWLREALRFQTPRVVVLETLFFQDIHPEFKINTSEGLTRKCIDPMRWSKVKLDAVADICKRDPSQNALSYFLLNIRFHDRWKSLTENDFLDDGSAVSDLLGWAPGKNPPGYDNTLAPFEASDGDASFRLREDMVEYFGKIAALCKERGIRLVLVKTPQDGIRASAPKADFAYRQLAGEYGLDFFNLGEATLFGELRVDPEKDSVFGHGNIWGNIKVSRWMGGLLRDRYHVAGVEDRQYEGATRRLFAHVVAGASLGRITDVDEYLDAVRDGLYAVALAVKGDAAEGMRDSTKAKLKALGLRQEWTPETMSGKSYIGIVSDSGIVEKSGGPVAASGLFRNGYSRYAVSSAGTDDEGGAACSINIDGKEYALTARGLNMVVYDLPTRKVVDRVCFEPSRQYAAKRLK